jgi:hypothetical protein
LKDRLRERLTYANVVSTLCLFLLLGGTAAAVDGSLPGQNTVGSEDIINGEVAHDDLGANSVGSDKIIDGRVKNPDLGPGAADTNTLRDNGVRSVDVRDDTLPGGGLTGSDIAPDAVSPTELTPLGSPFDDTAPIEATPFVVRALDIDSGVGAQPNGTTVDHVIYNANAPRSFQIIDAWLYTGAFASSNATWQLRDEFGAKTPAMDLPEFGGAHTARLDSRPDPLPVPAGGTLVVRMTSSGPGTWSVNGFDLYILALPA